MPHFLLPTVKQRSELASLPAMRDSSCVVVVVVEEVIKSIGRGRAAA